MISDVSTRPPRFDRLHTVLTGDPAPAPGFGDHPAGRVADQALPAPARVDLGDVGVLHIRTPLRPSELEALRRAADTALRLGRPLIIGGDVEFTIHGPSWRSRQARDRLLPEACAAGFVLGVLVASLISVALGWR